MNLEIKSKTALVTGSTAGIGLAIAERLLREGASVIINGRTEDRVEHSVRILRDKYTASKVKGFVGDLTDARERERLYSQFEAIDILINNLGVYESKPLSDIADSDWLKMFDTNVVSGAALTRYYLKSMMQRNWGRIIFIASETGVNIPADMIHYGVSKAAQIALARGIAELTKGTAVTVNSVLPGPTLSEGVNRYLDSVMGGANGDRKVLEQNFISTLRPTSLIQRFASSEEVANLVAYLSSPLSSATNGAAIRVEGGLLRNAV